MIVSSVCLFWFQSPSLRGSGRFVVMVPNGNAKLEFQSPSLRGSGRFEVGAGLGYWSWLLVSIPFIAGQWSLPIIAAYRLQRKRQVSIPFIAGQWSLQALARLRSSEAKLVSIPFIAGQWSLRFGARPDPKEAGKMSQSPSLRGSGRFSGALLTRLRNVLESQSPSLRGSGRFDSPGD